MAAGEILFSQKGCDSCHTPPTFSDSGTGSNVHDIGTIQTGSGMRLSGALPGIDTPSLLGAGSTAPYLHNGSAATLEQAIEKHVAIATTAAERIELASYVRSLSGREHNLSQRGVVSGTPVLSNVGAPAVTIDSLDDQVRVPHSSAIAVGQSDFSVSFWMKLHEGPRGVWRSIMHKGNGVFDRTFALWLTPNSDQIHMASALHKTTTPTLIRLLS